MFTKVMLMIPSSFSLSFVFVLAYSIQMPRKLFINTRYICYIYVENSYHVYICPNCICTSVPMFSSSISGCLALPSPVSLRYCQYHWDIDCHHPLVHHLGKTLRAGYLHKLYCEGTPRHHEWIPLHFLCEQNIWLGMKTKSIFFEYREPFLRFYRF